jgi:carbamoyltransferase
MTLLLGLSGAKRNACAAACVNGELRAACEQERLTRVRRVGFEPPSFPVEAVDEVLRLAGYGHDDVTAYIVAERQARLPAGMPGIALDHHRAHAATAFLTSPFDRAAILVCDSNDDRELSVWKGDGSCLQDQHWPWWGSRFAALYSECAELFGFARRNQEHQFEALAHLGRGDQVDRLRHLFRYEDGSIRVAARWRTQVSDMIDDERRCGSGPAPQIASAVQRRIGELLLEFIADVAAAGGADAVCLGGGLFYNTYFTTLIRRSGAYPNVFVPINPGNAGLAVGASLLVAHENGAARSRAAGTDAVSPFLGPAYDSEAIKATLDGCKLSYSFLTETEVLDATVTALARGQLVAWFHDRMEWGPKALGHRSILANPRSPYVLDNLNCFLRKRERWRSFGVSVCEDIVADLFCGPPASPFMEYEYELRDDRLRPVMPAGATAIRVQTVSKDMEPFWALHKRMEQATGIGVLVNTSFNGFHEPIACTPRDAVRVFFGTGLDMLVMGRFILRK